MTEQYTSLNLNGKTLSKEQLIRNVRAYNSEIAIAGWEKNLYDFIGEWLSDAPGVEVQTSGSTGNPHTFKVNKDKMIASARRTGDFLDLKKKDKALLCLPLNFIAGKMMVVRAFVLGLNLITVKPSSNPLADIEMDIDFAAMTPMQVHYALQTESGNQAINRIGKLIIGGGAISRSLQNLIKPLATEIWHTYGMAETLTHVAMKKLTGENRDHYFHALPGVTFRRDDRKCLVIKAPWLSDKEIITNDVIHLFDETTFGFKGRIDNIINSGGIKLSPESIEKKLGSQFSERFIITGLPDEVLGQKPVLVIEGKQIPENRVHKKIKKAGLTPYEKPRQIYFMYHFPQTESGKLIRKQINDHLPQLTSE